MRVLRNEDGNIYSVRTKTRSLTHRVCSYGDVNGFWRVLSEVKKENGVFYVNVSLIADAERVCNHLNLILE